MQYRKISSSVSAVVIGGFPLTKYNIKWLFDKKILTNDEIQKSLGTIISNEQKISIEVPNEILLSIEANRLQIIGSEDFGLRMSQILKDVLCHKMPEKISAIGINGFFILELEIKEYYKFAQTYMNNNLVNKMGATMQTEMNFVKIPEPNSSDDLLPLENQSIKILSVNEGNSQKVKLQFSYNNHFILTIDQIEHAKNIVEFIDDTRKAKFESFEKLFR